LENCAATIFGVEMHDEQKVDIDIGGVEVRWVIGQANRKCGRKIP
jgi:hypothetical protein